jgi:hypothetical protein
MRFYIGNAIVCALLIEMCIVGWIVSNKMAEILMSGGCSC